MKKTILVITGLIIGFYSLSSMACLNGAGTNKERNASSAAKKKQVQSILAGDSTGSQQ